MEQGMNERDHEELRSLLGAFALNATSAPEARRVERHIESCDECAHEVGLLRDSASALAWLPEPADTDELVDRISRSLPARPRRIFTRVVTGIAAAAIAAAGFLGVRLSHERAVNAQLADVLAEASRRVSLAPRGGFQGRGVLHLAAGRAALVLEELPDPGRGRTYQLWAIAGARPRSMVVVDGSGRVVRLFEWRGLGDSFALTIEPSGGSPVPTSDPVLLGG
jgi:anti-sigma-K factor RskA